MLLHGAWTFSAWDFGHTGHLDVAEMDEIWGVMQPEPSPPDTETYQFVIPNDMKHSFSLLLMACVLLPATGLAQTEGNDTQFQGLETQRQAAVAFLDTCTRAEYPIGLLNNLDDAVYAVELERAAGTLDSRKAIILRSRIRTAYNAVKKAYGKHFVMDFDTEYDTDRGFRHPGGFHTQADFDRVRAQLAAGNATVTKAYNVLKNAAYAQPTVATSPSERIVRGGTGENYINAARGATMAYQNALRWKIEDNKACADAAVRVLMAWAKTTKLVTGDSNSALGAGIYGYQFAQAAELMRDYEGWSRDDFETFRQWMLDVWYRPSIGFLRVRNGTWENSGTWWQAPGHYWSNWGLCNALCVISVGILCDDVFIYNQGMSFFKYDQVGTFRDPRTETPIKNDGLTEFLGNLVVTTSESELETGAYGRLGQMNESGRDAGHPAMALGLAVDLAHMAYNQGDDMFAYMDHRLAAGIEYVAAQALSTEGLPWTDYVYGTNGFYYTDSRAWTMTEPVMGVHVRPCWGTVVGHYEGVKGVRMPFSEQVLDKQGIDGGGAGSTSGGYDQLGYSVLLNTRDTQLAPADRVPTELRGFIEYDGQVVEQSDLGGLRNTYAVNNTSSAVTQGKAVRLMPQLPDGEEDTGKWTWSTGATTRDIDVTTGRSQIYRVTYTNANGVESEQAFSIAVMGDCNPQQSFTTTVTLDGTVIGATEARVPRGSTATITVNEGTFGSWEWDDGSTGGTYTTPAIVRDRDFYVVFTNQGGAKTLRKISIKATDPEDEVTGLVLYHDFETLADDGSLPDLAGRHNATLSGSAERRFLDDGNHAVFTGTRQGYVDLGAEIGADILSRLSTTYTISLDLCVTSPNQLAKYCWAWAFSNGTSQYLAMVNKAGNADWYYEIKDGGASQTNSSTSLRVNQWHTVTVVQNSSTNTLYIDGEKKASASISLKPATFGYQLVGNWLGRSPFSGDAYLENTYLDNLRIYNTALSAEEVQALADARPTSLALGDETPVETLRADGGIAVPGDDIYDLQGRKVAPADGASALSRLSRGIYIANGRKWLVR